jgi:hypothetical protein
MARITCASCWPFAVGTFSVFGWVVGTGIKLSTELKQKLINGGHSEALIVYDDEVFMKADRMQIRVNHYDHIVFSFYHGAELLWTHDTQMSKLKFTSVDTIQVYGMLFLGKINLT